MSEGKKLVLAFLVGIMITIGLVACSKQAQDQVSEPDPNAIMLEELKNEISGLNSKISDLSSEVTGLRQETTDLKANVEGMASEVTKLQEQLESTTGELTKLKDAFKNLGVDF